MGTVYVLDSDNHRAMRWFKGSKSGSVIIGGQDSGNGIAQLLFPDDLTFDRQENLYVADFDNHRVQMFTIDKSSCVKGTCGKSTIH
jgi:sugar lactone lactonase YvrE